MRSTTLAAIVLCLLGACTSSPLPPDAPVTVSGRTVDSSGQPVSGARLRFRKTLSGGEYSGALRTTLQSAAMVCIAQIPPPACNDISFSTTSAPDGRFAFNVTGADVQGGLGDVSIMDLAAQLAPRANELSGAAASARFAVTTTQHVLPDLAFFTARPQLASVSSSATASWTTVRPTPQRYRALFDDNRRGLVWSADSPTASIAFDSRLLEDSRGGFSIDAVRETEARTIVHASPRVPFVSDAGIPVSRGARCWYTTASGEPFHRDPCPLTDGDFDETRDRFPSGVCGAEDRDRCIGPSATIDLGTSSTVELVVARHCPQGCLLETSLDGNRWTRIANSIDAGGLRSQPAGLVARPPAPLPARYVRVTVPHDCCGLALAEVSVWDKAAAGGVRVARIGDVPSSPRDRGPLIALALVLLIAVAALLIIRVTPRPKRSPKPTAARATGGYLASILGGVGGTFVATTIAFATVPLWFHSEDPDADFILPTIFLFIPGIVAFFASAIGAPVGCWLALRVTHHRGAAATALLATPLVWLGGGIHPFLIPVAVLLARAIVVLVLRKVGGTRR